MIEQDTIARVQSVALAIVHRRPIRKYLRYPVRTARPERRLLILRNGLRCAEHFAARSLIKPRPQSRFANGFQNPNRADAGDIRRVFRNIKADPDVALRSEMINLVRL